MKKKIQTAQANAHVLWTAPTPLEVVHSREGALAVRVVLMRGDREILSLTIPPSTTGIRCVYAGSTKVTVQP